MVANEPLFVGQRASKKNGSARLNATGFLRASSGVMPMRLSSFIQFKFNPAEYLSIDLHFDAVCST